MTLGAIVSYALIVLAWAGVWLYRRRYPAERRFFEKATIAYTAGPLLNRHIGESSELWVTGGDGLPLHKESYIWHPTLKGWLDKGCTIHYLLVQPTAKATAELQTLVDAYGSRFEALVVDESRVPSSGPDHEIVTKMQSFHFIVSERPKLIWIERKHLPGTCEAEGCEFVPPEKALRDERHPQLLKIFKTIAERYGVQIGAQRATTAA